MTLNKSGQTLDEIPVYCEGCQRNGLYSIPSTNEDHFVVCSDCGWETSMVWCEKCGMGGDFVSHLPTRPKSWVCPDCETTYSLPAIFYRQPVYITFDNPTLIEQEKKREKTNKIFTIIALLVKIILLSASITGLLVSGIEHAFWLLTNSRLLGDIEPDLYKIAAILFLLTLMGGSSQKNPLAHYKIIPLGGRLVNLGMLIYSLAWSLTGPFGSLKELPPALRMESVFHQNSGLQALIMWGFCVSTFYWIAKFFPPLKKDNAHASESTWKDV
jgi:hypothetical protein